MVIGVCFYFTLSILLYGVTANWVGWVLMVRCLIRRLLYLLIRLIFSDM